jgi:hypothetical protein
MRIAHILAVMALVLMMPAVFAQPMIPFCCGSPWGVPDFPNAYMGGYWECVFSYCPYACGPCETSQFGFNCEGYYGYQFKCDGGDDHQPQSDVDFDSSCDGNVVTVDGAGNNAHVVVKDSGNSIIAAGDTDAGEFIFDGCDLEDLTIKVTRSGYAVTEMTGKDSVSCSECGEVPVPGCTKDSDCATNEKCSNGNCVQVQCPCGEVKNHACEAYACCADNQCPTGQVCKDHTCKPKDQPPQYECTNDGQCADSKYCDVPAGAAGGNCREVPPQQCGEVKNHVFVAYGYECGSEPGCPSCPAGSACSNHKCVGGDINCPSTGLVGDKKTCAAQEDGQPCANCDYTVTDPAGGTFSGRTDESGNFDLPLTLKGTYEVSLVKDGQVVKVIQVQAFPQAQPDEGNKPAAGGGPDVGLMLALLLLLLLVVVGIVYWRSRGKKK